MFEIYYSADIIIFLLSYFIIARGFLLWDTLELKQWAIYKDYLALNGKSDSPKFISSIERSYDWLLFYLFISSAEFISCEVMKVLEGCIVSSSVGNERKSISGSG